MLALAGSFVMFGAPVLRMLHGQFVASAKPARSAIDSVRNAGKFYLYLVVASQQGMAL